MRDEAQHLLDGLTIKHVHLETGTLAFLIQHCYGLRGPDRRMNALLAIFPSQTMERSIETNFHEDTEERGLLDTKSGDANPRACFSQRNLAKEKYYPKGIAFLQKQCPVELNALRRK